MKIYKRKDGRFSAQVKQPNGKYKTIYGKTKREVNDKYLDLVAEYKTKPFVERKTITFTDYYLRWIDEKTVNKREGTIENYKLDYRTKFKSYFGNKQMQKITKSDCQKFVNKLAKTHKPRSVKTISSRLKKIFTDAVNDGIISANPAKNLIYPEIPVEPVKVLKLDEIGMFIDKAKELYPNHYDIFEFLILTGLRFSELRGLLVTDYDFDHQSLEIKHQLTKFHNKDLKLTPTKTNNIRTLILSNRSNEIVNLRIKRTLDIRKEQENYNPKGFIFWQEKDTPYKIETLRLQMKNITKTLGLDDLTLHDLRHTNATLSLALGTDIKTVQDNLGHTNADTTLKFYSASTDSMKKELNNKFDNLWENL